MKGETVPRLETSKKLACAIYARVSTSDQNCQFQLEELRAYCERRGWEITGEYVDSGWSATRRDRPEFARLMKDAAEHRFGCVAVWKLDRFGRSVLDLNTQIAVLKSCGVRFVAVTQGIDTDDSNPVSGLVIHILAAVAQFEREMGRERVMAGMTAAKRRGVKMGRPRRKIDTKKVLALHRAGHSNWQIAIELGTHRQAIWQLLKKVREETPAAAKLSA